MLDGIPFRHRFSYSINIEKFQLFNQKEDISMKTMKIFEPAPTGHTLLLLESMRADQIKGDKLADQAVYHVRNCGSVFYCDF